MIDTAKPYFHMTDYLTDRLQDEKALLRKGVQIYDRKRFFLKHPFGLEPVKVEFNLGMRVIWIDASLPKLLQGHNVFGTNRLQYLCLEVLKLIYRQLGLKLGPEERRLVKQHRIRLGRLDCTASFRMRSRDDVAAAIEMVCEQLRAEGRKWASEGIDNFETAYNQKHSTRVSEKVYDKYAELMVKRHAIPKCVGERDRIMEYAKTMVRFEVTWRAPELKRLGMEYADQWTPGVVRQKLMGRLNRLNLQGEIKQKMPVRHLNGLDKGTQSFYNLWKQGCNLRVLRRYAPLKRARKILLGHSVDIFRPREASCEIALKEIFVEENAYFYAPKGLIRRGCIFGAQYSG